MTPEVIALIGLAATLLTSSVIATWVLSNKIANTKVSIVSEIAQVKTDLGILKEKEAARDDKINQMWAWWLKALERGWTSHMEHQDKK